MTDAYNEAMRLLDLAQKEVGKLESQRVIRVVKPSEWTSTEKPDLSFHKHGPNCEVGTESEICEVSNDELRRAYLAAASMLSSVRFMMGVPGVLSHDEGVEPYEDAKLRADFANRRIHKSE